MISLLIRRVIQGQSHDITEKQIFWRINGLLLSSLKNFCYLTEFAFPVNHYRYANLLVTYSHVFFYFIASSFLNISKVINEVHRANRKAGSKVQREWKKCIVGRGNLTFFNDWIQIFQFFYQWKNIIKSDNSDHDQTVNI